MSDVPTRLAFVRKALRFTVFAGFWDPRFALSPAFAIRMFPVR